MAILRHSADLLAIRHDVGLFGGISERDTLNEIQMASLKFNYGSNNNLLGVSLVISDRAGVNRVVYNAYQGALAFGDTGISPLLGTEANWATKSGDVYIPVTTNTVASMYQLMWGTSRFSSIEKQVKVGDTWLTTDIYDASWNGSAYLPARFIQNNPTLLTAMRVALFGNGASTTPFDFKTYYNNFDYQAAIFNTPSLSGSDVTVYLFGDDNLSGTRLDDVIRGGCGNDTINGGAGSDILQGDYGADNLYGDAGNDVLVFSGGSSVWDYKADVKNSSGTAVINHGAYKAWTIDTASGGSGKDTFVFSLPDATFTDEAQPALTDLYVTPGPTAGTFLNVASATYYNPFQSQSLNATLLKNTVGTINANGVSNLTMRTKILDFKVGEDRLDLSNFGLDTDFLNNNALSKKTGAAFIAGVNAFLKTNLDGVQLTVAKNSWTDNNTTIFVKESAMDLNGNGNTTDTLLEIQLVGIAATAISIKMFGEYNGTLLT